MLAGYLILFSLIQDALEILQEHAELRDGDHDYSRALAFRRASCVLKSMPFTLSNMNQLRKVLNIGDHSRRVIQVPLTLSTLGKIFSRRHFEIFFLFFPENRI